MTVSNTTPRYLTTHGSPHRALERRVIATGPPGFRLRFYQGVQRDLRFFLVDFARWLRRVISFRHPVRVTVVPHATVMGLDGAPGWAVFLIPSSDYATGDIVRIFLAGGKLAVLEGRYGFRPETALARLAQDLAHEVVHYEQWRDGRAVSERGVNRRAEALVRSYLKTRNGISGSPRMNTSSISAVVRPGAPRSPPRRSGTPR